MAWKFFNYFLLPTTYFAIISLIGSFSNFLTFTVSASINRWQSIKKSRFWDEILLNKTLSNWQILLYKVLMWQFNQEWWFNGADMVVRFFRLTAPAAMLGLLGAISLKNLTKWKEGRKLEKELIRLNVFSYIYIYPLFLLFYVVGLHKDKPQFQTAIICSTLITSLC